MPVYIYDHIGFLEIYNGKERENNKLTQPNHMAVKADLSAQVKVVQTPVCSAIQNCTQPERKQENQRALTHPGRILPQARTSKGAIP